MDLALRPLRRGVRVVSLLALVVLLGHIAGCATPFNEYLGARRIDVVSRQGVPTASFPLSSGGERLLYSALPAGYEAYILDFDHEGRLVRNEQVLQQTRFEQITKGDWTTAELQRTFGPPLRIERVARFDGDIWTYHFLQNSDPRLAHVHVDPQGWVRRVTFTDELPLFDNDRD